MIFHTLTIEGFRSFGQEQVLEFPSSPALTLLTGKNKVEPDLGRNGAGKSSIWDALSWVLYGKTTRNLRAAAVVNKDYGGPTRVSLAFEVDGDKHTLIREQSPNRLKLGDTTVTQQQVDDLLQLDHDRFSSCVVLQQFGRYFLDLEPTAQLDALSKVLGLDVWQDAAKRAKLALKDAEEEAHQKDREVEKLEGSISATQDQIKHLQKVKEEHEAKHAASIEARAKEIEQKEESVASLKALMENHQRDVREAEEHAEHIGDKIEALTAKIGRIRDKANRYAHEKTVEAKTLEAQADVLAELEDCPTCHQTVSDKHAQKLQDELWASADNLLSEAKQLRRDAEKGAQPLQADLEKLQEDLADSKEQRTASATHHRDLAVAKMDQEADIAVLRKEQERPAFQMEGLLVDARTNLKDLRAEAKALRHERDKARKTVAALDFWPNGFKELRLWVIEEALAELRAEMNNSLVALGLRGWSIDLAPERESKKGSSIKSFTVTVTSPAGDTLPYKAFSGGEAQRLRLASALAVSSLIASRRPDMPSIEVFDEPTAHLSDEGVEDLVRFLAARPAQTGRSVYLVDHRSIESGAFDDVLTVVKTAAGSEILGSQEEGGMD